MLHRRFEKLFIPYLEGSLDPQRRAMLEEEIANDSTLAAEVEEMRRLKYQLQRSAANFTSASSNKSAWPGVQARISVSRKPVFGTPYYWGLGLSMSATAALVLCFGTPYMVRLSGPMSASNGPNRAAQNPLSITAGATRNSAPSMVASANGFVQQHSMLAPAAYDVTRPNILPVAARPLEAGNQVQLADANISDSSPLHTTLAALAPYNMPFVQPSTTGAVTYAAQSVDIPAAVEPVRMPQVLSGNAFRALAPRPSANPVSQTTDGSLDRLGATATASQGAAVESMIASPTTVHLAMMSATANTSAQASTDSPLITQLRAVDDQAASDASIGAQSRALARWQSVLQATSSSAIFGDDSAQLLSTQSLEEIEASGLLSSMRQELEQWQEQDPNNIGVRRMLASLYGVQGETSLALDQRRKAAALPTAIGEDWFQLGLSEEQAGNADAANADYNKALKCGDLSNTMHLNFVRQRLPQSDS